MKNIAIISCFVLLVFGSGVMAQSRIEVGNYPQTVNDSFNKNPGVEVETWLQNLEVPWDLVFLPDSKRALFTERKGLVRHVKAGKLQEKAYLKLDLNPGGENGLMGITLHPEFPDVPYVYLMYTYHSKNGNLYNRVSRFKDLGERAGTEEIIIDQIPAGNYHAGGRIEFGPDQMLYITTGDSGQRDLAQQQNSLAGKILRLTAQGKIPTDNPDPDSPIYSSGHRNPQGLAWHPQTEELFISDHGPSGEAGLRAKDRIKVVRSGANFGWPVKIGAFSTGIYQQKYANPLIMWRKTVPPSGMTFYQNSLFVATLGSQSLVKIDLKTLAADSSQPDYQIEKIEHWFRKKTGESSYGRIRTAVTGPDGYLYFLTNNLDGRGNPRSGDDKILRFKIQ